MRALVTPWAWAFAGGATLAFMALLGLCFALYGGPFIHEAFLYHLSRYGTIVHVPYITHQQANTQADGIPGIHFRSFGVQRTSP